MYKIRGENANDITEIKKVNDLAFGQENEARLVEGIRNSDCFVPELSLVAETNEGDVIGHILFSKVSLKTTDGSRTTLALAPMAVKPEWQSKGVGSALVREGLKQSAATGYDSVVVLGHPAYYPRFGFVRASSKGIKAPFDVSDEVFMVYELVDGALSGLQGTVHYPEAFKAVD